MQGAVKNRWFIRSRIVYFHRKIKNGIDFDYVNFKYFNFVKQVVDGVEFEITAKPVKQLNITANYTFISGEETTQSRITVKDTSYNHLLRRPKHNINMTIGYQFNQPLYASISGKAVSGRYDTGGYQAADIKLDGYFILNAYAEYKCKSYLKFFADFQNITGKDFFDIRGYNAIPFLVSGGVSLQL